jgi:phospholipid/cholesterol/gamma-HCH transport system substrate-binding protein
MAQTSNAAKVGIMAVVLAAALVFAYRFISRETGTGGGYYVWAYVPDATGIAPHSRVLIGGIQVGVIDRIWLDKGTPRIDVKMNPEITLYEDALMGKRATSLIGEYFVVLVPGTEGKRKLGCKVADPCPPEEGQIKGYIDEPSIQSLQGQISDILKDIKKVTETLSQDTSRKDIKDILENLASVTKELNETVKDNRAAITQTINNVNNITGNPDIPKILENVRSATDDLKKLLADESGKNGGKPGELREAIQRVDRASSTLEDTLKHADNVAARIDRGEGTVGRLTKDETLINEVENTVETVGDLVGGIGRVQTVVSLRSDYNFLANSIKSYVELRLQPTEDKYYSIEVISDPRGKTTFEQLDVDTTNANQPSHYRELRTITTDSLRFSFQFAKRIGPFTGRFGIKESTGGIGLDLHLLDDRLELRQDIFGFGEELTPRWRVALGYEFIRKLWLLGGVDDILNQDRRDYFVGLQLRFTDTDLKTILPFAPSVR